MRLVAFPEPTRWHLPDLLRTAAATVRAAASVGIGLAIPRLPDLHRAEARPCA